MSIWDSTEQLEPVIKLSDSCIYEITKDVNIFKNASQEFINLVVKLETTIEYKERAKLAKQIIDTYDGIKEIDQEFLTQMLLNPSEYSLDFWRRLYVLERSIPPRFGDAYTWFDRLKIFANTYQRENAVDKKAKYQGNTLYLVHGNVNARTNHDKLVYGQGKWGSDFYFYDNSLSGSNWQKMVKVEMKYGKSSLDEEIKKYRNNKFTYDAKLILFAMSNGYYIMVDYNCFPEKATKLELIAQDVFKVRSIYGN